MRVLITGGGGFIGSHLSDRLVSRKDEVLVIDNFSTGAMSNLASSASLAVVEGTIADPEVVTSVFREFEPEVVVHAAASYKDPNAWAEDNRTNSLGTAIVVQAAKEAEVSRLIYLQTALCYGVRPLEQPITLDHPLLPGDSSYAISKTAGEYYVVLSGVPYISFRLANAYGPRNLSGPLPTFYQRLVENKPCHVMDTRRDFIYVSDVVDLILAAIDGQGAEGAYHISSGSDYSIKEFFEAIVEALDLKLEEEVEVRPRSPDDAYTILLDPSKTEQDFNWKANTPLRSGIHEAVDWFMKQSVTETYTHLKQPQ